MLRIIIAILLCSILVYSKNQNLKAIAIGCLLIQAYSDTRINKKKESFKTINNPKKQISGENELNKIIDQDIKVDQNRVKNLSKKMVDLIYKENPEGCLNKDDFKKRVTSNTFLNLVKQNALSFI